MQVDFMMLADGAEAAAGKIYILGGGWTTVAIPAFPAGYRMSITFGIRVGWNETNERHTFRAAIETADAAPIVEAANGAFEAGRPPGLKPGVDQVVLISTACELALTGPGDFVAVLDVDGERMKRLPFYIIQGVPQMMR